MLSKIPVSFDKIKKENSDKEILRTGVPIKELTGV